MVLHQGRISEMKTARQDAGRDPRVLLECAGGHGVHVVTVNDYLAKRDAE